MASLICPVRRVCDIATADDEEEENDLEEEPSPASTALRSRCLFASATSRGRSASRLRRSIEILGVDRDDIVIVAQLACLGGEAKIGYLGNRGRLVGLEAKRPLAFGLVLELQLEVLVLEVRQAELGRDVGLPDAPSRATRKFSVLPIGVLVVRGLPVTDHGHHVRKHQPGTVVLVSVEEDAQALELVSAPKDGPLFSALLCDPHGKSVAIELVLAVDLELHLNFPIRSRQWHSRE